MQSHSLIAGVVLLRAAAAQFVFPDASSSLQLNEVAQTKWNTAGLAPPPPINLVPADTAIRQDVALQQVAGMLPTESKPASTSAPETAKPASEAAPAVPAQPAEKVGARQAVKATAPIIPVETGTAAAAAAAAGEGGFQAKIPGASFREQPINDAADVPPTKLTTTLPPLGGQSAISTAITPRPPLASGAAAAAKEAESGSAVQDTQSTALSRSSSGGEKLVPGFGGVFCIVVGMALLGVHG